MHLVRMHIFTSGVFLRARLIDQLHWHCYMFIFHRNLEPEQNKMLQSLKMNIFNHRLYHYIYGFQSIVGIQSVNPQFHFHL